MDGETVRENDRHEDEYEYKYDVALSYASEQREIVRRVEKILAADGLRVFYDETSGGELIAQDLYAKLYKVFRYKSRYTAAFVSADYLRKKWTMEEAASAKCRNDDMGHNCIIPICFGDADLSDLDPDIHRIHADGKTEVWIAEQIQTVISKGHTAKAASAAKTLSIQEIVEGELIDYGIGSCCNFTAPKGQASSIFPRSLPLVEACKISKNETLFLLQEWAWPLDVEKAKIILQGTIITDRGIYCKTYWDEPVFTTWAKFVRSDIEERMMVRSISYSLWMTSLAIIGSLGVALIWYTFILDYFKETMPTFLRVFLLIIYCLFVYLAYSCFHKAKKARHSNVCFFLKNGAIIGMSKKGEAAKMRGFLLDLQKMLRNADLRWDLWTSKKLDDKKGS